MTAKYNMKKAIINDFDKKKNYNCILKKIGENKMDNMEKYKKFIVPGCLVTLILICGIVIFNNSSKSLKNTEDNSSQKEEQKQNVPDNIIFNDAIVSDNSASIDAHPVYTDIDGSAVEKNLLGKFSFLSNLNIPHDYELKRMFELYVRGDNDSSDYNKLWQYDVYFTTANVEPGVTKEIGIIFTQEDYILSCYEFNWNDFPKSTINGIDVGLYSDGIVTNEAFFEYEGYKIYVKSNDITKDEFINLIKSMIK